MLILPFIPFSGKAWAFFLCSLAIGHHCIYWASSFVNWRVQILNYSPDGECHQKLIHTPAIDILDVFENVQNTFFRQKKKEKKEKKNVCKVL
jgi:hypothetical protein